MLNEISKIQIITISISIFILLIIVFISFFFIYKKNKTKQTKQILNKFYNSDEYFSLYEKEELELKQKYGKFNNIDILKKYLNILNIKSLEKNRIENFINKQTIAFLKNKITKKEYKTFLSGFIYVEGFLNEKELISYQDVNELYLKDNQEKDSFLKTNNLSKDNLDEIYDQQKISNKEVAQLEDEIKAITLFEENNLNDSKNNKKQQLQQQKTNKAIGEYLVSKSSEITIHRTTKLFKAENQTKKMNYDEQISLIKDKIDFK